MEENQVEGQERPLTAEEEFNQLLEIIEKDEYKNQGYLPDKDVTINGTVYSQIVVHNRNVHISLESFRESVNKVIDKLSEDADKLSIQLMREHIKHIETGQTVSGEELDKLDAKVQINERTNTRKSKK